ncbi:formyltetrahydrofolate deformylase [Pedobacter frigiditerrae]|uniref:Formyltetrahydrofolate deformylase n=1 Tax=Pedobacter frigiditerrae TaxID=2530452 RepID=A0A4R0N201_9SPHI|nr:formyltetrahydrofolate deformylase [Pedobacter frigiditerrae]TCC93770.1 formyltetrahydrofolate deformylase [Pedobacter frigiditerrae]
MNNLLVLIQCKDSVGLVTNITRVLAQHQLNIIAMREFVDEVKQQFFTRIECSGIVENHNNLQQELLNNLPTEAGVRLIPEAEKSIALLVTKEFHCLADILVRDNFKTLGAKVKCVIGNHETLRDFAEKFEVPFFYVSHEDKGKADFENEITSLLSNYQLDYIVLAKFMRILSPDFIAQYSNQIINIHHSFLPAFIGANPYKQAFERGVKIIGATAHFVTNNLDEGPIISQQTIHVNHTFDAKQMAVAGREIEKAVLSKALEQILEDRVFVSGNKTIVFE